MPANTRLPTGCPDVVIRSAGCGALRSALTLAHVAAAVPFLVSVEMGFIDAFRGLGLLAAVRHGALVTVLRMKSVVDVAAEVARTMKPRAGADEDVPGKPFRTVIAGGGAVVGGGVVVTIRTFGGYADADP